MKAKRYYIESELINNSTVILEGEEHHHLKNVMRSRVGDEVILFNGSNLDAYGIIKSIDKNSTLIQINNIKENENEPTINFTLYQAVCKGDKLSLITQKITELGASNLCVFYSKFTDIKDKTSKLDKLDRVSISASKQCGRSSIVKTTGVLSFNEMIDHAKSNDKVFVAYENENKLTLFSSLKKNAKFKNIGLIIGAEGGFSEEEIEILKEKNFEIISLGKRILRTETAGIVGSSTIIFACEEE